jgi:hypothetical protein
MKTPAPVRSVSAALCLGLVLALPAVAKDTKPAPTFGDDVLLDLTAQIEAINAETREVTLKGSLGNVVTLTAGPQVKRFNEFKVGDEIKVEYYASLAAEIRPPTDEEKATPYVVLEDKARAPEASAPGGGALRILKAVGSVEGLDRTTATVTLKGPNGNYATAHVKDAAVLENLHLGDSVIVVYTEALAIRLEKAPKPAAKP